MSALPKCPTCRKPVLLRPANPMFPFCSARCKAVDLGKWLGEEYRMPDATAEERDDGLPSMDDDEGAGSRGDA